MFGLHSIGVPELGMILLIALIFFGPSKLPSIGKAVGQSIREFKAARNDGAQGAEPLDGQGADAVKKP